MIIGRKNGVVLRHGNKKDFPKIDEITITCYSGIYNSFVEMVGKEIYKGIYYNSDLPWPKSKTIQNHKLYEDHPDWLWVLSEQNNIFGYVSFKLNPEKNYGLIDNNAVLPAYAGRGWGKFMFRHVLEFFRTSGLRFALVETGLDDVHIPARRAYEGVGFDHQDRITVYYQDLNKRNPGSEIISL
ncbi:MAG: GNAT family N-acetyltransferase [Candidatus Hodarchaeales archaeon]|jgi:ribosomal protein S18 acetylase RimI-like enzyme